MIRFWVFVIAVAAGFSKSVRIFLSSELEFHTNEIVSGTKCYEGKDEESLQLQKLCNRFYSISAFFAKPGYFSFVLSYKALMDLHFTSKELGKTALYKLHFGDSK